MTPKTRLDMDRKWKTSGLVKSGSPEEFMLRVKTAGMAIDKDDVMYLVQQAGCDSGFRPVVEGIVSGTDMFDETLSDLVFYLDYYVKSASNGLADQMKYGRSPILDMFMNGMVMPCSGARDGSESAFMKAFADKVDKLFEGRLVHVRYFRQWLRQREKKART